MKNLALIFTIETPEADIDTHYGLCLDVLLIYNHFAVELSAKLTKETWYVLLLLLLVPVIVVFVIFERFMFLNSFFFFAILGKCFNTPC